MNEVLWNRKALETTRDLPEGIKKEIGLLIKRLQLGEILKMPFSRSMPSLGRGCHELRVRDENGNFRVFYYQKLKGFIVIFHVFEKKSEKTLKRELEIAKKNLKELLNEKNDIVITRTSRELAEALGLTPADAVEWDVRIKITKKIISTVQKNGMTVTEIAKEAGTSRGRVTKILKGNTFGISLDVLFRVLGAVGEEVKISFKRAA